MLAKFGVTLYFDSFQLAVRLELFPHGHHERRRKLPLRANQNHLVHKSRRLDRLLDWLRRDVLAARSFEQLFLTIRDAQESVRIDCADVARLKPAIAGEHRARFFGLVVIAAHHVWTTHLDLAVFSDANVDIRNRFANRADAIVVYSARGDDGRRLSQSITLDDWNTRTDVDVREIFRQRSATRNQQPHAPAERALPFRKHQLQSDPMFEFEKCGNRLMRDRESRIILRHRYRPRQQRRTQPTSFRGAFANALINLFENPRHADQHRRTHLTQVWTNGLYRLGKVNCHALMQVHVHRLALENV